MINTATSASAGIDDSRQFEVFEILKQIEDPLTKTYRGVGIGLGIVKHLVDLIDGTISLDSAQGEGTLFTLQLPLSISVPPLKGTSVFRG